MFETWTWGQLGWHEKPIGMLDVRGFYTRLLDFICNAAGSGFLSPVHQGMLQVANTPEDVLSLLRDYVPPTVKKYVGRKDL
jgi:predicted Rossmann-fold nucleotide-binding protein